MYKGYPTQKKELEKIDGLTDLQYQTRCEHGTITDSGSDKRAVDTVAKSVYLVTSDAVEAGTTARKIVATGHSARVGDLIRFTNGDNVNQEFSVLSVPDANTIVLSGKSIDAASVAETFEIYRWVTPRVDSDGLPVVTITTATVDVVDQIDTNALFSVAGTNITASSGLPVELVASLAAECTSVEVTDDIGEFLGLYIGNAGVETLKCVLPIAGGVKTVNIPAGTRVSIRNMKDDPIATDTYIAINFIG